MVRSYLGASNSSSGSSSIITRLGLYPPPFGSGVISVCRYLSHGQEWSEKLRIREKTRVVMTSLCPVWDEKFALPVRR